MKKDLLKMEDLSKEEILDILNLADQLKYERNNGIDHSHLKGKTLGMIFQKSSTRTRVSFEVGMYQLGGNALFLSSKDLQIGRGEPICDTSRVLARYLDGIMIRTYHQQDVEDLANFGSIPIINGLTDEEHPCQVLADLMTIREYKKSFNGLKIAFIGDGNNMAHSLLVGSLTLGMDVAIASPTGYEIADYYKNLGNKLAEENNINFTLTTSPLEAVKNADVVITDVWTSMGQEAESKARLEAFAGYQINEELMSHTNSNSLVLHCLPAHRDEEISSETFDKHSNEIFDEAENRLHAQKAVLVKLLGKK